jgi:hypothetical protein
MANEGDLPAILKRLQNIDPDTITALVLDVAGSKDDTDELAAEFKKSFHDVFRNHGAFTDTTSTTTTP